MPGGEARERGDGQGGCISQQHCPPWIPQPFGLWACTCFLPSCLLSLPQGRTQHSELSWVSCPTSYSLRYALLWNTFPDTIRDVPSLGPHGTKAFLPSVVAPITVFAVWTPSVSPTSMEATEELGSRWVHLDPRGSED